MTDELPSEKELLTIPLYSLSLLLKASTIMNSSNESSAIEGKFHPVETQSISSLAWTPNTNGQSDHQISRSFENEPMLSPAMEATYMSFSPIAKKRKPKMPTIDAATYPSQELRSHFVTESTSNEEIVASSPTSTDDDDDVGKLPPPPPLPPSLYSGIEPNETVASPSPVESREHQDDSVRNLDGFVIGLSSPALALEAVAALQTFKSGGNISNDMWSVGESKRKYARTSTTNPRAARSASLPRALPRKKRGGNPNKAGGIKSPGELDILKGRGGYTNLHPGNIKFRGEARALRSIYRDANTTRNEKYQISMDLVDKVHKYGGKFLEKGEDELWYECDEDSARKKASQVLREEKWD